MKASGELHRLFGPVVDDDDLERAMGLRQRALDRFVEVARVVEHGDDHGDRWLAGGRRRAVGPYVVEVAPSPEAHALAPRRLAPLDRPLEHRDQLELGRSNAARHVARMDAIAGA